MCDGTFIFFLFFTRPTRLQRKRFDLWRGALRHRRPAAISAVLGVRTDEREDLTFFILSQSAFRQWQPSYFWFFFYFSRVCLPACQLSAQKYIKRVPRFASPPLVDLSIIYEKVAAAAAAAEIFGQQFCLLCCHFDYLNCESFSCSIIQ